MPSKIVGFVVIALLSIGTFGIVQRALQSNSASAEPAKTIDCYKGVSCPIIWHPPSKEK